MCCAVTSLCIKDKVGEAGAQVLCVIYSAVFTWVSTAPQSNPIHGFRIREGGEVWWGGSRVVEEAMPEGLATEGHIASAGRPPLDAFPQLLMPCEVPSWRTRNKRTHNKRLGRLRPHQASSSSQSEEG